MSALQSDAFVFFGATGDLAFKQVFPALNSLVQPGRSRDSHHRHGARRVEPREAARPGARELGARGKVSTPGDSRNCPRRCATSTATTRIPQTFDKLRKALGSAARPIHYLAIPPSMFGSVVKGLANSGCAEERARHRREAVRPRSCDGASARPTLHEVFPEGSIFRIDHISARKRCRTCSISVSPTPSSSRSGIAITSKDVQITMAETFGVQGRGGFLRGGRRDPRRGAEPSAAGDRAARHGSRRRVTNPRRASGEAAAVPRHAAARSASEVVRGQIRGYRDEKGVAKDSQVETFAALRLHIDTWRWAGVPFYIRPASVCRSPPRRSVVTLKCPPLRDVRWQRALPRNYFPLSPQSRSRDRHGRAGEAQRRGDARRAGGADRPPHTQSEKSPYERLLGDAVRGDTSLFTQDDCVEAAWRVVDPVLHDPPPVVPYEPRQLGPAGGATKIIEGDEAWHDPDRREASAPC